MWHKCAGLASRVCAECFNLKVRQGHRVLWPSSPKDPQINVALLQRCAGVCRVSHCLKVLRACFGACRVNHLLRSLDFKDGLLLADRSSVPFRHVVDQLLQGLTTDEQFKLACMASRRGGLGLKNPTWTHGPAFLSSCFTYAASTDAVSFSFWNERSSAWHVVWSVFDLPVDFLC